MKTAEATMGRNSGGELGKDKGNKIEARLLLDRPDRFRSGG